MIQTESNNDKTTDKTTVKTTGQATAVRRETNEIHDRAVGLTRTRCPGCQKLFAVETEMLLEMSAAGVTFAEFTCTAPLCREAFAISLPLSDLPDLRSNVTIHPAMRIEKQSEPTVIQSNEVVIPVPQKTLKETSTFIAGVGERECPRCGTMNVAVASDCVRCGIIFERYAIANDAQLEEEIALGGTRELAALWGKLLEDYEDRIRHDRFLNACRDASALSYAAKKYSQILIAAPQDDIARLMRNRIVALVAARSESSRLPINLSFRIPKLNSMALFGGSFLFFWGLWMPQLKSMMEIGLSLMLLSIGVRLALRARI